MNVGITQNTVIKHWIYLLKVLHSLHFNKIGITGFAVGITAGDYDIVTLVHVVPFIFYGFVYSA